MLFESKSGEDQCEPSNFERHVLPLVGVVRCNWFNSQKRLATITYGTGVFISPRIILTCTHNVYSSSRNVVCDEVYFSPGIEKDSLTSNKIYQSKVKSHFKFKQAVDSFNILPLNEEITLILLSQFQSDQEVVYPQIGCFMKEYQAYKLRIVGYPSQNYYSNFRMDLVYPERKILEGEFHSLQENIINHTMPTTIGFSGSPIFAISPENQYFIIGIHTHRGMKNEYNSGLCFTQSIVYLLKELFQELKGENGFSDQLHLKNAEDQFAKEDTNSLTNESSFEDSDDQKYDNLSKISCYDDLLEREEFFSDYQQS